MAKVNHSSRSHALLAPSGSSRWLNCTPSARLEEQYGERKASPYAEEGTIAHELCEVMLRYELAKLGAIDYNLDNYEDDYEAIAAKAIDKGYYGEEMVESAHEYVDTCVSLYEELKASNSYVDVFIEMKTDLREYIPEAFGSIDFCTASDGHLYVVDFKYGKGISVAAEMNSQMMIYALGALHRRGKDDGCALHKKGLRRPPQGHGQGSEAVRGRRPEKRRPHHAVHPLHKERAGSAQAPSHP